MSRDKVKREGSWIDGRPAVRRSRRARSLMIFRGRLDSVSHWTSRCGTVKGPLVILIKMYIHTELVGSYGCGVSNWRVLYLCVQTRWKLIPSENPLCPEWRAAQHPRTSRGSTPVQHRKPRRVCTVYARVSIIHTVPVPATPVSEKPRVYPYPCSSFPITSRV